MSLRNAGELITVSSPRFMSVDKSFLEKRECLRHAQIFPTIVGNVNGLDGQIHFQRSQLRILFSTCREAGCKQENLEIFEFG